MIGIIFDCDGTLIDSEYAHFVSWAAAARKRGVQFSVEEYPLFAGHPSQTIAKALHERAQVDSPEAIIEDKRINYETLATPKPPIERTVAFVRELLAKKDQLKIKLGLASAGKKKEILRHLAHIGLSEAFEVVVSGQDDLHAYQDPEGVNKPKPYIYLEAARQLGLAPSQCIAFEDSRAGMLAAKRAGLFTFAVPNAYTKSHDFSEADKIIHSDQPIDLEIFFKLIAAYRGI